MQRSDPDTAFLKDQIRNEAFSRGGSSSRFSGGLDKFFEDRIGIQIIMRFGSVLTSKGSGIPQAVTFSRRALKPAYFLYKEGQQFPKC